MDNDQKVRRANEADRILKSEIWRDFWQQYRDTIIAKIENAKTDEGTIRGKLLLGVMNDARAYAESILKEGQYAAHEIQLETERKKRGWFSRAA